MTTTPGPSSRWRSRCSPRDSDPGPGRSPRSTARRSTTSSTRPRPAGATNPPDDGRSHVIALGLAGLTAPGGECLPRRRSDGSGRHGACRGVLPPTAVGVFLCAPDEPTSTGYGSGSARRDAPHSPTRRVGRRCSSRWTLAGGRILRGCTHARARTAYDDPVQVALLVLLAALMTFAGVMHFVTPGDFIRIVPRWLPAPAALVAIS